MHFARWGSGPSDPVDPTDLMHGWGYVADPREIPPLPQLATRNAALTFQDVDRP